MKISVTEILNRADNYNQNIGCAKAQIFTLQNIKTLYTANVLIFRTQIPCQKKR